MSHYFLSTTIIAPKRAAPKRPAPEAHPCPLDHQRQAEIAAVAFVAKVVGGQARTDALNH